MKDVGLAACRSTGPGTSTLHHPSISPASTHLPICPAPTHSPSAHQPISPTHSPAAQQPSTNPASTQHASTRQAQPSSNRPATDQQQTTHERPTINSPSTHHRKGSASWLGTYKATHKADLLLGVYVRRRLEACSSALEAFLLYCCMHRIIIYGTGILSPPPHKATAAA